MRDFCIQLGFFFSVVLWETGGFIRTYMSLGFDEYFMVTCMNSSKSTSTRESPPPSMSWFRRKRSPSTSRAAWGREKSGLRALGSPGCLVISKAVDLDTNPRGRSGRVYEQEVYWKGLEGILGERDSYGGLSQTRRDILVIG